MRRLTVLAIAVALVATARPSALAAPSADVDLGFHSQWVSETPWPTVDPGTTTPPISIVFRNVGTRTWTRGDQSSQVNLGIVNDDRSQSFLNAGWPTPDRVTIQTEASVLPGQTATFSFRVAAPSTPGTYQLRLRPVVDGVTWLEDQGVFIVVAVRGAAAPTPSATVVQSGMNEPWDIAFAPDGRMFVTERPGNIQIFATGQANAARVGGISIAGVHAEGEAGAMGIALDPSFSSNGLVYVCVSRDDPNWVNQVLRYRETSGTLLFDNYVIRDGMAAGGNHDGCRIRFGPDGKLWVTMGEVGNEMFAQNPNSLNGKVLRVNSDGSIPADNPVMPGASGRSAVYTMGHRNPQGIAFQPLTGYAFDVEHAHYVDHAAGVSSHATVNRLTAGGNYSWPYGSGPQFIAPVWQSRNQPYVATSGGSFVSDPRWGSWNGSLFLGCLAGEMLLRLQPNPDGTFSTSDQLYVQKYGRLRGVTAGPDGALYITGDNGIVLRVAAW